MFCENGQPISGEDRLRVVGLIPVDEVRCTSLYICGLRFEHYFSCLALHGKFYAFCKLVQGQNMGNEIFG
jgi:hypothetical protein